MRFLYGDTEPFPPQYNFLSALEAFMSNAARAVKLDAEVRALRDAATAEEVARAQSLEALTKFHEGRMHSLAQHLPIDANAETREYVRQLSELAASIVESAKAASAQASELARHQSTAELGRRHAEIKTHLTAFLTSLRLPATSTHASMRLQDGHNELSATIHSVDGLAVAFALTTREHPAWQAPRKVSDFVQGIDLRVGVRRSWFSKGVQHEMTHIDDYILGGFELTDDSAEIRLRKKPGEKDTIVFDMRRDSSGALSAEVHHPGDPEAEGLASDLDAEALGHLGRFWDVLRSAAEDVSAHRERVLSVTMEGIDVVDNDRVALFVACVIRQIAPTVVEIAKRSSNAAELSLKAESEKGRREELYVAKAELLKHLEGLGPEERDVFSPLALVPVAPGSKKPTPRESGPDDGAWDVTS
jgi:hypothetical protein